MKGWSEFWTELMAVGLLTVKRTAKGKQRSRAQIRESGLAADIMAGCCRLTAPATDKDKATDLVEWWSSWNWKRG